MSNNLTFVEHRGHRIAVLAHTHPTTDRPPIVWLHGLTGSVRFWEAAMYPELDEHHAWYSVGLPLHHPSTYAGKIDDDTLDEQLLAELLDRVVRGLPADRVHLVGYSVGGFAALNYAAKYPERVASVVSIGGFLTGRARGLEGVVQTIAHAGWWGRALFRIAYWTMQRHRYFFKLATLAYARRWRQLLAYPALDPTIRNIFPDVRRHPIRGQRAWFRYLLEMDLLDEVAAIRCPVLVVAGDADPIIPFVHQQEYAALLPNAELTVLRGVGHVPFGEAPAEFRRALLDWFA